MAIPLVIGTGFLVGLGAYLLYDDDDDDDDDDYDYQVEREAQRQRELALQAQREREQKQREESIRQHTKAFMYKHNLNDFSVDNMAYLVTRNSDQAVDEFKAAYEETSEFKHLNNQINNLQSELAQINQLSSSLG